MVTIESTSVSCGLNWVIDKAGGGVVVMVGLDEFCLLQEKANNARQTAAMVGVYFGIIVP
jgi:hypothetical protein